ncbi:FAD-binding protein, partial [Sandarakinorhabdus oryzae]|uniref:FAD-binding protein n=1 Tax=Sandarakinorhabdus oryzae TaxID=2675220 RepID=UPI0012E1211F
ALVWGGTRIGQLNRALAARGRSIRTSGSHDGQTVAGAVGTGVHGGAHAQGGFQNHVRGLHIVAGPGRSWWLERRSDPVLADGMAVQLGARLIRDDRLFDSALIHLGGMGVINAALIDTVPLFVCDVLAALAPVSPDWLGLLAAGDWRALARAQGHDDDPYFMEVTLDPAAPFTQPAMHTLYFKRDAHDGGQCALDDLHLNQPLNCLGRAGPAEAPEAAAAPPDLGADIDVAALLRAQFRPCAIGERWGNWGELNGPHRPLAPLYNAAFAVPRARVAEAVQAALAAVAGLPRHFVFTLRPVDGAAGGLAFTRFGTNVVINLDGLGTSLSPVGPMAAAAVRAALDGAGIPYSLHWGKLGGLDAAKVAADFGPARDQWRAARRRLLGPAMRQIITNPALVAWGLD